MFQRYETAVDVSQVALRCMAGLEHRAMWAWKEGVAWQKASRGRLAHAQTILADRRLCHAFDAW